MEEEVICVKVYNDHILDAQHKDNKDVDNDALIKYNKHDGDLVNIDDTSNPECDIGKPPKRDTKVVMEEHKMTTNKCRDQPTYQDDMATSYRFSPASSRDSSPTRANRTARTCYPNQTQ